MKTVPTLTTAEWQLIAELLERERKELHPEIRRCRTTSVRDELNERLRVVEDLLSRIHAEAPA